MTATGRRLPIILECIGGLRLRRLLDSRASATYWAPLSPNSIYRACSRRRPRRHGRRSRAATARRGPASTSGGGAAVGRRRFDYQGQCPPHAVGTGPGGASAGDEIAYYLAYAPLETRINMHREIVKHAAFTGQYSVAALSGCAVYASDGPSPLDFLPYPRQAAAGPLQAWREPACLDQTAASLQRGELNDGVDLVRQFGVTLALTTQASALGLAECQHGLMVTLGLGIGDTRWPQLCLKGHEQLGGTIGALPGTWRRDFLRTLRNSMDEVSEGTSELVTILCVRRSRRSTRRWGVNAEGSGVVRSGASQCWQACAGLTAAS